MIFDDDQAYLKCLWLRVKKYQKKMIFDDDQAYLKCLWLRVKNTKKMIFDDDQIWSIMGLMGQQKQHRSLAVPGAFHVETVETLR